MRRLLITAARILGPILLTRFMRKRKNKRSVPDENRLNIRTDNETENTIEE